MSEITPEAAQIADALDAQFPGATDLGIFDCRRVRDLDGNYGDAWSQHAWGNAVGRGHSSATVVAAMHEWLQRQRRAGTLPIGSHDGAILHYPASHVHVEGPQRTGTPPCAGGSSPPDVLNPPQDDGTAEVPGPGSPQGTETRESASGPLGGLWDILTRIDDALDATSSALATVTDAAVWLRVLQAAVGIVLAVTGIIMVGSDVAGEVAAA